MTSRIILRAYLLMTSTSIISYRGNHVVAVNTTIVPSNETRVSRIIFGSCNTPSRQGFWGIMSEYNPDRVVLLGDNMYADSKDLFKQFIPADKRAIEDQYALLADDEQLQQLVQQIGGWENLLATWDDHDYGINDGDKTYLLRDFSKQAFLDFFNVPLGSPRRDQEGVYTSQTIKVDLLEESFTYKIILLDTRYNKDPYSKLDGDFLGEAQWSWLESELADQYVDLVLLGSSIQVLPTDKVVEESWSRFPAARDRLLRLIRTSRAADTLIMSGDIHTGEILKARCGSDSSLIVEFTSSGLTHTFTEGSLFKGSLEPGRGDSERVPTYYKGLFKGGLYAVYQILFPHFFRESPLDHYQGVHFGLIDVYRDPASGKHTLQMEIIGSAGTPVLTRRIPLNSRNEAPKSPPSEDDTCEPFWGPIPRWRIWLCMCGLSVVLPLISIGAPAGLAALLLKAGYNFVHRRSDDEASEGQDKMKEL